MRWSLLVGLAALLAVGVAASVRGGLVHMGVPFVVEPEKTYWKYRFEFGGDVYEALDQPSRDAAVYAAQHQIETLKGAA